MASLELCRRVQAKADLVWQVVSDLEQLPGYTGGITQIEQTGADNGDSVYQLRDARGDTWRLIRLQELGKRTLRLVCTPMDATTWLAELAFQCEIRERSRDLEIVVHVQYRTRLGLFGVVFERFGLHDRINRQFADLLDGWIRVIHAREWAYRVTVATLLGNKGSEVVALSPAASVATAANTLREHAVGSVLALKDDGSIAGVLSERDIVRGLSSRGSAVLEQSIDSIMTRDVLVAHPEDNMMMVMSCMSEHRIRHLPVVEDERVVGVISIGDVVQARIAELEGESESLREYIEARRWRELYLEIGPAAYASSGD
jgi:CBS domain-containing protein